MAEIAERFFTARWDRRAGAPASRRARSRIDGASAHPYVLLKTITKGQAART